MASGSNCRGSNPVSPSASLKLSEVLKPALAVYARARRMSRALHSELKEYNIRVLCVSPASTKTDMGKLSKDQDFNTFLDPKEVAEFIVFLIPFDSEMIVEETRLNRMILK